MGRTAARALASAWLTLVVGAAVLADLLPISDPTEGGHGIALRPFGATLLGTDTLGRDILSRCIYGARTSLTIGCASVGLAMLVGVPIGLMAGYYRGKIETICVALSDVILAFPGLILLMAISAIAGPSSKNIIGAIAIVTVPTFIRLSRANTLTTSQREYVTAARGLGARTARVLFREVLPNVIAGVWAYALAALGLALVVEGSISFLGLGVQPPTPAWGGMIASARPDMTRAPHIVLVPAFVLFTTILACNALTERRTNITAFGTGKRRTIPTPGNTEAPLAVPQTSSLEPQTIV